MKLWNPTSNFELIDLFNDFFWVRFANMRCYDQALDIDPYDLGALSDYIEMETQILPFWK